MDTYMSMYSYGLPWHMRSCTPLWRQEAVDVGMYSPLEVMVETDRGAILCRTYRMNKFRASPPSPQYKEVRTTTLLIKGLRG